MDYMIQNYSHNDSKLFIIYWFSLTLFISLNFFLAMWFSNFRSNHCVHEHMCLSHSVAYWDQRRCGLTLTSGNMSSVSSCPQLCLPCCWKVFTPPPPTLTETGICEESRHANFQQFISLQHHLRAIFQKVTLISLSWKHCLTTMLKFVNFPYVVPNMCHFLLFSFFEECFNCF